MEMICFRSFSSRVAFPVPIPAWNPCRASWNWMEDNIRQLIIPDIAFHRKSIRTIRMKLLHPPLGVITTVCQAHSAMSYPPLKTVYMIARTFSQILGSGFSSRIFAQIHILRFSSLMSDGIPTQCSRSCSTASVISSSPGIDYIYTQIILTVCLL